MPGFIPKKFPGKLAEPMLPFYIAGLIVFYGVNKGANAMMDSDEFRNDPRNPRAKNPDAPGGQH
ncbi:hypothetical protein G647_00748 [Cladophialophora carrionii CBS 160.54]|uniref:ATP synthase subunit J, mitochondrial n=2 Tax=Cladophialophora carrionii TaxID=86049 RepID=A0A1C1CZ58_9EURO|nr:uncharacterized protein G647_00748 [Cladophialophora carrionii CBS 160.54]ETI28299.1 hypothetical protein G647_00748 [Cladophialophora carrionii CBS 160.54]OCT53823.1 ATP synthase subunit J, mitochondrial [Cladophialophora carrionii]